MATDGPSSGGAVCLLQLPDTCLVAVLRCCADDPRSMFSAARAHSRLHQAAKVALSSIKAVTVRNPRTRQQMGSLLQYLSAHGQHVESISVKGVGEGWDEGFRAGSALESLASDLTKLSSLTLEYLYVQLHDIPYLEHRGVLGAPAAPPLKQLRLHSCVLLDHDPGLAAALSRLTGLEHLSIRNTLAWWIQRIYFAVPAGALQMLQQLTYIDLSGCMLQHPADLSLLQGLTRLQDMRLRSNSNVHDVPASMLSGSQQLTHLELTWVVDDHCPRPPFEPAVLTGQAYLQHFALVEYGIGDSAGVAQLLSQLQQLQQLTYLDLSSSLFAAAPAGAYSALTASSKLQHLKLVSCTIPAGAWQRIFPPGRQLPKLQELVVSRVVESNFTRAAIPGGSSLVSCCPGLRSLQMAGLQCSTEGLAALQGLSGLTSLSLSSAGPASYELLQAVCQLRRLRHLDLYMRDTADLLQLSQLQQLTHLQFNGGFGGEEGCQFILRVQGCADEPIWRQVLRLHLNHDNPQVAQQAVEALAEGIGGSPSDSHS